MSTAERLEELRDLPLVTAQDRERITDAQAQAHAELLQHFAAMARRGECEFVGFGLIDATPKDAYGQPSAGGRGWCRGLAGVSK